MLNRQNGFSLIEVITVVAILGIAMAFAIPNISSWMASAEYRDAAQDLMQSLRRARSRAVAKNLEQQVRVDIANNRFILLEGDSSSNSTVWTPNPAVAGNWTNLLASVALRAKSDCSDTNNINFTFSPNGTAEIQPAVVPPIADVPLTGSVCIMDPNNLAGPAKFTVSVPHNSIVSSPIISNTGRAIVQ